MTTAAIFVDVQNVYYTTRSAFKRNFDYNQFWARVSQTHEITVANAYAIDRGDEKQRQFQNILRAIGFDVKLKPFIQRADGTAKGDWDVGITIDMLFAAQQVDKLILVSGDGDFALLVDTIRQKYQIEVDVYGVEQLSALALTNSASQYHPIDDSLLL
ncbi:NYN domain-containing protein [Catenovulum sp. SM1970]|uniref:NYN domain-containing protein n=1 Tax=Marinifaba aquimaris TaxID=2741323 RepID=UPI0015724866|nr:NYN domain-containing protein [Marinifaba aquimaris]NTS76777.1 NYN domain-containing protein [Marinifaba aquimaris]